MGLPAVLFLILLVLKLTDAGDVAAWSWWWVTAPLWIVVTASMFSGVNAWAEQARERRRRVPYRVPRSEWGRR